jgi:hypothetical protein
MKHTWLTATYTGLVHVPLLYCLQVCGFFVIESSVLAPGVWRTHVNYLF